MATTADSKSSRAVIEPTYAIELKGFSDSVVDPIDALMRGFGVSAARAETILGKLPTVVKHKADAREALRYARTLVKLGAEVEIRSEGSGTIVSLQELTGFERVRSNVIESADPAARAGSTPRAAFKSGSHPSVTFPKTAAGVALTPTSLSSLTSRQLERAESNGGTSDTSRSLSEARGPTAVERVRDWSSDRPLIALEQALAPSSLVGDLPPGPSAPSSPRASSEAVELDETAIPAGRHGASVPAMPEVLRQIRDFEATGWDPLRPDVGLGSSETTSAVVSNPPPSRPPTEEAPILLRGGSKAVVRPPRARGVPKPKAGAFGRGALAVLVGAMVVALVYFAARWFGGVSSELRAALEAANERYLPSMESGEIETGSLGQFSTEDVRVPVRAGRCYGFIATTDEPMCDLDLYLFDGTDLLFQDTMLDNTPVVFHCPTGASELRLRLSNAGLQGCGYGLAHLEGQGSVGWPLEPYLRLYPDYLTGLRGGPSLTAVGPVGHGTLSAGEVDELEVVIPGGLCYSVLAVVQQGSDLDLRMEIDGQLVGEDASVESYALIGYCASGTDVRARVEVKMFSGQGPYVHQVFEGRLPAF